MILETGTLSYALDTKYRLEPFVISRDEMQISAWATLWVDSEADGIQSCKIAFEILHENGSITCMCFVNDTELSIEYEADEIEGTIFEF